MQRSQPIRADHWDPASATPRELSPEPLAAPRRKRVNWGNLVYGFILGVLVWTALLRLGIDAIPDFRSPHMVLLVGLASALVARTRARVLFGVLSAAVCVALLLIMYTPIAAWAVKGSLRVDRLEPVEAVAVLNIDMQSDGTLTEPSRSRILHCLELLRQDYAGTMIWARRTGLNYSAVPAVRRQMDRLRISYPIADVGLAEDTHDEAVAVALKAGEKGWKRIILVSHPVHMRRAAAAFEAAGVKVICSPCPEGRYDLANLGSPDDRLEAFRDWLHEAVGYQVYRLRGWL